MKEIGTMEEIGTTEVETGIRAETEESREGQEAVICTAVLPRGSGAYSYELNCFILSTNEKINRSLYFSKSIH